MTYLLLALGGLLLAALAILLLGSQRHRRLAPRLPEKPLRLSPSAQLLKLQNSGHYWGVRIESHCGASSQLVGRTYSFENAPNLPVEGCGAAVCECGYAGLAERRKLAERRSGIERRTSIRMDSDDRRADRPRREADFNSWAAYGHL